MSNFKSNPDDSNGPKTVGIMLDSVDTFFNSRAISDLIDACEERSIRPVFFFGGSLERSSSAGRYSYAYSLPNSKFIDALIVFPHSIAPYDPIEAVRTLIERIPDLPVYSFFGHLPAIWSIGPENSHAIQEIIHHLHADHAYTKFALLTGPDAPGTTSRERQLQIEKELHRIGITIPDEWIFPGTYSQHDGKTTAAQILKLDGDTPEVLICMNDQMAIGAVTEFQNHGISVPGDIAVVGFDDVEENSSLPTSFTSVNFPIWEMVSIMMDRVVSDLNGITSYFPEQIFRPAQFMHRESCGCSSWFDHADHQQGNFTPLELTRTPQRNLKKLSGLRRSLESIIDQCLQSGDYGAFTSFMQGIIQTLSRSGHLSDSFIDLFSTQWTSTLLKHNDKESQILLNSLFLDAFRLLIQTKQKSFRKIREQDLGSLAFYREGNELLSKKITIKEAVRGIGANLPILGIEECHLVFLNQHDPKIGDLRFSFYAGQYTEVYEEPYTRFPVEELLPKQQMKSGNPLAALPLAFNNYVYGYLVVSITDKLFSQFDMIQDLVSRIIDAAMGNEILSCHIETLTQNNSTLSRLSMIDEFTGLYNRRALDITGKSMFDQAVKSRQSCCFIFLDMDGLKKINDSWGHKEGDQAILSLAEILKASFRERDLVARYGGDEFVVLMINVQENVVIRTLERISAKLDSFNQTGAYPWTLSASWGFSMRTKEDVDKTFESLIEESDAILYQHKKKKRSSQ